MTTEQIFSILFLAAAGVVILGAALLVARKVWLAWHAPHLFEPEIERAAAERQIEEAKEAERAEQERERIEREQEKERAKRFHPVFFLFGAIFGGFILYFTFVSVFNTVRAYFWKPADCTVLSIGAKESKGKNRSSYTPQIVYEYEYEGAKYIGDKFNTVGNSYSSGEIDELLKKFKRGTQFTCFVNPSDSHESFASRDLLQWSIFWQVFGTIFGLFLSSAFVWASFQKSSVQMPPEMLEASNLAKKIIKRSESRRKSKKKS